MLCPTQDMLVPGCVARVTGVEVLLHVLSKRAAKVLQSARVAPGIVALTVEIRATAKTEAFLSKVILLTNECFLALSIECHNLT